MDKTKARSFSVKGPVYWHVKSYCEKQGISMRDFITDLIEAKIGTPPEESTQAPQESDEPVREAVVGRPSFMQPQPVQIEPPQSNDGLPDYNPPIQFF